MSGYHVRAATLEDLGALVHHRLAMFEEMGTRIDSAQVGAAFRQWLMEMIPGGGYQAWVIETTGGAIVGGGGLTVLPWPPGPSYVGGRIAFVYNVYVEPGHRRRGLARQVMEVIHAWCAEHGLGLVALNASRDGRALYEALGYQPAASPMMFAAATRQD